MKAGTVTACTITSMNLLCGVVGVVFAFGGRLDLAFVMMLCAAVCDFADGFAARLLHGQSEFGKQLDSLCDAVSFGVLPAVMLHVLTRDCMFGESLVCYVPLLIAVFAVLRLARFNAAGEETDSFKGLAAPAAALLTGSLCSLVAHDPAGPFALLASSGVFTIAYTAIVCCLMVSRIPMMSLKLHRDDSRELQSKRICLAAAVLLCIGFTFITGRHWTLAVNLSVLVYVFLNLVLALAGPKHE